MPESGKLPEIVVSVVCMQTVYMWPKSRKEVRHYREHWVLCVPSWRECDVWFRSYALSVNHSTLQVGASVTIPTTSRSIGNYPYPPFIPQGQVKSVKSNVSRSPWTSKDCWSIAQRCFRAVFNTVGRDHVVEVVGWEMGYDCCKIVWNLTALRFRFKKKNQSAWSWSNSGLFKLRTMTIRHY